MAESLTRHAEKTPTPQGTHSSTPTPSINRCFLLFASQRRDWISYPSILQYFVGGTSIQVLDNSIVQSFEAYVTWQAFEVLTGPNDGEYWGAVQSIFNTIENMLATDIGPEEFEDRPSDPKDAAGKGYALGIGRLSQMPMPLVTVSLYGGQGRNRTTDTRIFSDQIS